MTGTPPDDFVPPPSCWRTIGVYGDGRPTCPWLARHHHCRHCEVFLSAARGLLARAPGEELLAEWAARLAEPEPAPPGPHEDVLVLVVGDRQAAVPVAAVREVVNVRTIRRLPPPAVSAIVGLVSVRGDLLPCVSLDIVLGGRPENPLAGRRLVVVGRGDEDAVALLVSDVAAVRRIEVVAESPDDLPDQVAERPLVRRVLQLGAADVPLVDPAVLVETLRRHE